MNDELTRVDLDVIGQGAQLTEMLGTVVTVVGFLTRVDLQMVRQSRRLTEGLITNVALIGLLAGVDLHVIGQSAQLPESAIAHGAVEGLLVLPTTAGTTSTTIAPGGTLAGMFAMSVARQIVIAGDRRTV